MDKINMLTLVVLPNAVKDSDQIFYDVIDKAAECTNVLSVGGFELRDEAHSSFAGSPFLAITSPDHVVIDALVEWLNNHKNDEGEVLYASLTLDYSYEHDGPEILHHQASIAAEKSAVTTGVTRMVEEWAKNRPGYAIDSIEIQLERVAPVIKH